MQPRSVASEQRQAVGAGLDRHCPLALTIDQRPLTKDPDTHILELKVLEQGNLGSIEDKDRDDVMERLRSWAATKYLTFDDLNRELPTTSFLPTTLKTCCKARRLEHPRRRFR